MIIVRVLLAHVPVAYHRGVLRGAKRRNLEGGVAGYAQNKDDYLKRLRRIEGQVRGLARMVEGDRYCIDIMTQLSAVRAALRRAEEEILADHAAHCVENAIASGNKTEQRRKVAELIDVISRSNR